MHTALTQDCLEWFDAHARGYLDRVGGEVHDLVRRKISHTMRVLAHMRAILNEQQPPAELAQSAEIAAILHDVARFPQLVDRKSFDDHGGFNHAERGADILAGLDLLDPLSEHWRAAVITAVRYHNRDVVPDGLEADARTLVEMLRDADKLDALRNNLKYMNPHALHGKALKSGLTWHATEVSPDVVRLTLERGLIPFKSIHWSNDFVLFLCCWLYDLHVPYAYRHLVESGVYEGLLAMLPDAPPFVRIKAQLRADLARLAD